MSVQHLLSNEFFFFVTSSSSWYQKPYIPSTLLLHFTSLQHLYIHLQLLLISFILSLFLGLFFFFSPYCPPVYTLLTLTVIRPSECYASFTFNYKMSLAKMTHSQTKNTNTHTHTEYLPFLCLCPPFFIHLMFSLFLQFSILYVTQYYVVLFRTERNKRRRKLN